MAYTNWQVGDIINICAQVEDFCGAGGTQFLNLSSADIQKYPTVCNLTCDAPPNCPWSCIDTTGREVIFKSVRHYTSSVNDVNCSNVTASRIYRELGRATSNSTGTASLQYTVTNQDKADYLDALANGQIYAVVCCINNSLATSAHSIVFAGIAITENLCSGVTCPDICVGNDLYTQICNPTTGTCIQGTLKEANNFICTSTDYIEYDFSFLPKSFLDLVSQNVTKISNGIGAYLPSPSNVQYKGSTFNNGKFRVYVSYTQPVSLALSDAYGLPDKIFELSPNIVSLIELSLDTYARIVSGLIVFLTCQQLLVEVVGLGTIASIVIGAIGAVVIDFGIHNISLDTTTKGTITTITPVQNLTNVDIFIRTYGIPSCTMVYPGCVTVPPTCDAMTMRLYNSCMIPNDLGQCLHTDAVTKNTLSCDTILQDIRDIDAGLANGTMTPAQAQAAIANRRTAVATKVAQAIAQTKCDPGVTVYNPDTKSCVKVEDCTIRNPFGGCILSKSTASDIATIGILLVGGYVAYKLISSRKGSPETIIKIQSEKESNVEKTKK